MRGFGNLRLGQAEKLTLGSTMEDQVRKLDAEYGFGLSEDEIKAIARRVEEFERLFQPLYALDLTDTAPQLKLDIKA